MKKTILFVAFGESVHTARWLSQICEHGWDIHLYQSDEGDEIHPKLERMTIHKPILGSRDNKKVKYHGLFLGHPKLASIGRRILKKIIPDYRARYLNFLIKKLQPDLVHSLEIQHAGYLTYEAKKLFKGTFPTWIVTNWGSDIYFFGQLKSHEEKIREVLEHCDHYSCECLRDVELARRFGFRGSILPVFPNSGGFDLETITSLRSLGPVSQRRGIMLKGYQGWVGRSLVGLRAIGRCADLLKGYTLFIFSASEDVSVAADFFESSVGVPVKILPKGTSHEKILEHHGKSRISIGLSLSDAISTSLLEAMVMGSFPIQSWTACANEWIKDGKSGILVPPEDPDVIELAIRKALTDNELVDSAEKFNWQTALERLDFQKLKRQAIELYTFVLNQKED